MTDQPTITDAAVDAYIAASADWLTEYRAELRAGLAAAAPHIAAQVIRDHAKDLERRLNNAARDGGLSFEGIEAIGTVQRLNRLADQLEATTPAGRPGSSPTTRTETAPPTPTPTPGPVRPPTATTGAAQPIPSGCPNCLGAGDR